MHLLLFYELCPNPQPFKKGWPKFWIYKTKLGFFGPPEVLFAFFLLSTPPTAPCSQSNFHQRSSLKTVHRTVFFTVGFKSPRFLSVTKNKRHHNYGVFYFFGPPEVFFAFFLLSTSPTAPCSQSIFHQRSSLKTVHRTVFFTVGFKSLRFLCVTKKQKAPCGDPQKLDLKA